jgi:hypothetical protein
MPILEKFPGSKFLFFFADLFINYFALLFDKLFDFYFYFFFVHTFLLKKWFFDILQNKLFALSGFKLSFYFFFLVDKGFLEIVGPFGVIWGLRHLNSMLLKMHSQLFDSYYLLILIFFFFFL